MTKAVHYIFIAKSITTVLSIVKICVSISLFLMTMTIYDTTVHPAVEHLFFGKAPKRTAIEEFRFIFCSKHSN